jgi:hypothetical protein
MRWTRWCRKACGTARTVKPCGPVPPTLGTSSLRYQNGRRRLTSPVLRGERGAAVKPLRRECRAISALPDDLWAFFLFSPRGLRVRSSARHSLRPHFSEGHDLQQLGQKSCRENAESCRRRPPTIPSATETRRRAHHHHMCRRYRAAGTATILKVPDCSAPLIAVSASTPAKPTAIPASICSLRGEIWNA